MSPIVLSSQSENTEKYCLDVTTVSPILSDETFAFRILPLFAPFPRPPRLRPPRDDGPVDSLDVEDDLRLGKTRSVAATVLVEDDVDFEDLMLIGTKMSPCDISCNLE